MRAPSPAEIHTLKGDLCRVMRLADVLAISLGPKAHVPVDRIKWVCERDGSVGVPWVKAHGKGGTETWTVKDGEWQRVR